MKNGIRILWCTFSVVFMSVRANADLFIVDNLGDIDNGSGYEAGDGTNSLRKCIRLSNSSPGSDTIEFAVTGSISPWSALPALTDDGTILDGSSCWNGVWPDGQPGIVLDGMYAGSAAPGIRINGADNCHIRGIYVMAFGSDGIYLGAGSQNVCVGGSGTGYRNVISGNGGNGVALSGPGTTNNIISGNFIGTDPSGTASIANTGNGVTLFSGAFANTLGGIDTGDRNLISGNAVQGVNIDGNGTNDNRVSGNLIGLDVFGTSSVPNLGNGVLIWGSAQSNTIGGLEYGAGNVISGNGANGIDIADPGTAGNTVEGNRIGTDYTGMIALGNVDAGVQIRSGASSTTVGGALEGARNVISGNNSHGVFLNGAHNNLIAGNYIGTDTQGLNDLGNTYSGVRIKGGSSVNTVGGAAESLSNIICANGVHGVDIADVSTEGNTILGNRIGVNISNNLLGNTFNGIQINQSVNNSIGGDAFGAGNSIAGNGECGVSVEAGSDNSILCNAIFDNAELGIDLGEDGITINDPGDTDTGPNNLQNFPVLLTVLCEDTVTIITGTFMSIGSTQFRLDFFANDSSDASAYGEGKYHLGYDFVTTDAGGNVSFSFQIPEVLRGYSCVTSTATDPDGNTSEFSEAVPYTLVMDGGFSGGELSLSWGEIPGADAYWVYGASNQPFFIPGAAPGYQHRLAVLPQGTTTWETTTGLGDETNNWTFLVVAVDASENTLCLSTRVGESDYIGDIP